MCCIPSGRLALITAGQSLTAGGTRLDPYFEIFIQFCKERSIPIVIAAGNKPAGKNLHTGTPQHHGTNDNNIITVGAVNKDGTLWDKTAVPEAGKEGSMTVFAPGEVSLFNEIF